MNLDELLIRLAGMEEQARQRYDARMREEDEDYERDDYIALWFTLEEAGVQWLCGWRIRPDEAAEWAIVEAGATPTAAAQALLTMMEGGKAES